MKFDKNLEYKTRDGYTAKYVGLSRGNVHGDPYVFTVFDSEGRYIRTTQVFPNGGFYKEMEHEFDILPPKKTVYVNLYTNNYATYYSTDGQARAAAGSGAIAVAVPVEVDA